MAGITQKSGVALFQLWFLKKTYFGKDRTDAMRVYRNIRKI